MRSRNLTAPRHGSSFHHGNAVRLLRTAQRAQPLLPALFLGALVAGMNAFGADPFAENVRTTDPQPPEKQQHEFHLPPGFEIQLVASDPDLRKPMNMAFDGKGRLWVTESREYPFPVPVGQPGRDTIRIFSDFDANGHARKMEIFAEGLNIPIGIYPYKNGCIAWSIPNIWWFEDTDGDGKADKKELLYGPFDHTRDTHGNQSSFRRGFDGWLYATHGFNNDSHVAGKDGQVAHFNSGNSYRIRLDGSHIEHHTWGQVNPFGLDWDAKGNLYSSDCHSAPIYQLLDGGYYPSFGKPDDGLGFAPVLMEHSHGSTAIDGLVYYNDNLWPAEYQDNIFIGNVMTSRLNRDHLTFNGTSPHANEQPDFLTTTDPWFRPVNNQLGPDGALYIADFYNRIIGHYEVPLNHPGRDRERGRIWRVVYRGSDGQLKLHQRSLDLTQATIDQLIGELGDPNLTWRMLAMNELADRYGKAAAPAVKRAYERSNRTLFAKAAPERGYQSAHLLWLLYRFGALDYTEIKTAANHRDSLVRVHAMRVLKALAGWSPPYSRLALDGLKDSDPLVRRCAAEALGEHPDYQYLAPLLALRKQVPESDTHLTYVVRKAIRDHLKVDAISSRVLSSKWADEDRQIFADVAIAVPSANCASLLLRELPALTNSKAPRPPVAEVLKHAARYADEAELGVLATFARQRLPSGYGEELYRELERQFALFKSVDQGLQQRGLKLPAVIHDWGVELVDRYFKSLDTHYAWFSQPYEPVPSANPWDFQKRASADGRERMLISSFPHGEGLTGVLRSPDFELADHVSFWLCGHDGYPDKPAQNKNRVRLRSSVNGAVIAETAPPRNDTAIKVTWDTSAHKGEKAFVEAVDGDTGAAYAWLAFGDFDSNSGGIRAPEFPPRKETDWFVAASEAAARLGHKDFDSFFARIAVPRPDLNLEMADPDMLAAAARAWLALEPAQAIVGLSKAIVDPRAPGAYRERLGEMLAETGSANAQAATVAAMKTASTRQQEKLAYTLAGNPSGAETLLRAAEQGEVPARLLQRLGTRNRVIAAQPANAEERVAALTKGLPPPNDAAQKLIDERRNSFDAAKAMASKGEEVFTSNCRVCHQLEGRGALVGPQLDGAGNRGLERLLEDVLDPNRNVDRAFRTTLYTMQDGDVVSGLLRREEGQTIVLADSTGKESSIPKNQVKSQRESDTSLMPENFGETLSADDVQNLMAFLLSKRGKPAEAK